MDHPFQQLENLSYSELLVILEPLKPQAIAVIFYFFPAPLSGKLLADFPHSKKIEIVQKMEILAPLEHDAMKALASMISEKLHKKSDRVHINGQKILANLVRHASPDLKKCIATIVGVSPAAPFNPARKVKFEELVKVPDKYFQKLIKEIDRKTLLLAIKTEATQFIEKLKTNLSTTAIELLEIDRKDLGPVKKSDVIQAQESIVSHAYSMEEKGLLVFEDSGETIH